MLTALASLGLATAGLALVTQPAEAAPDRRCIRTNDTVAKLMECVTLDGVMEHQQALQDIADANGGNRSSGTSGYDASVDYVEDRLQAAGYSTSRQEFTFHAYEVVGPSVLQQTAPGSVTYVEGTDYGPTSQSEPGTVTDTAVTAVDLQLGIGNTSTSGCDDADWAGFPSGNIALIQRGGCTFEIKGEKAAANGASGIIFFNQGDVDNDARMGIPAVTLGDGYTGGIPAFNATYARGAEWATTPGLRMTMDVNVSRVLTTTENLIADLPGGDPHNVVMAGAHLDSVPEGPGINDNGSGSSALIEVAEQMAKLSNKLPNKVRFAWWGAEEANLVGSTAYVASLSAAQKSDIELYLNFDMIGSPNYGLFILDGDGSSFGLVGPAGSDDIEAHFEDFYDSRGEQHEPKAFDGRSDYNPFILAGIPAGGLFTGAEVIKSAAQVAKWGGTAGLAFDPCYHAECDTIENLSAEALDLNSDAVAHALLSYAAGYEVINQP
jgi:Zn-dependent M28 family amino/carboxypeptidase